MAADFRMAWRGAERKPAGIAAAIRVDPAELELKPASPRGAALQRRKRTALPSPPYQASAEQWSPFLRLMIVWGGWPRQAAGWIIQALGRDLGLELQMVCVDRVKRLQNLRLLPAQAEA